MYVVVQVIHGLLDRSICWLARDSLQCLSSYELYSHLQDQIL
jgi:hypothetical protein